MFISYSIKLTALLQGRPTCNVFSFSPLHVSKCWKLAFKCTWWSPSL